MFRRFLFTILVIAGVSLAVATGFVLAQDGAPAQPQTADGGASAFRQVRAMIESAKIEGSELRLVVLLPAACDEEGGFKIRQRGDRVIVDVFNSVPPPEVQCLVGRDRYDLAISLADLDLTAGRSYQVEFNDGVVWFTA